MKLIRHIGDRLTNTQTKGLTELLLKSLMRLKILVQEYTRNMGVKIYKKYGGENLQEIWGRKFTGNMGAKNYRKYGGENLQETWGRNFKNFFCVTPYFALF